MKKKTKRFSTPMYKEGGSAKDQWISDKIRLLEHEDKGRSHEQNIAIAFSMYEQGHKQDGGDFCYECGGEMPVYQNAGTHWRPGMHRIDATNNQYQREQSGQPTGNTGIFGTNYQGQKPIIGAMSNPIIGGGSNTGMFETNYQGWNPQVGAQPKPVAAQVKTAATAPATTTAATTPNVQTATPSFVRPTTPDAPDFTGAPAQVEQTNADYLNSMKGVLGEGTYGESLRQQGLNAIQPQTDADKAIQAKAQKDGFNLNQQDPFQFAQLYGGVDLAQGAHYLGRQVAAGNIGGMALGATKELAGLGRNFLGGLGQEKAKQRAMKTYYDNQYKNISGATTQQSYQDGGQQGGLEEQMSQWVEQGLSPQEIAQQLQQQGIPQEQIQQIITQFMQQSNPQPQFRQGGYYQEGGEQMPPQEAAAPTPPQGQAPDPQQLMQQIAEAIQQGADPNQIMQQLVQMGVPQEQAMQMVQQVMQQIQGQGQQSPQEEQAEGAMSNPQEEAMEQPQMQAGGEYLSALRGKTIKDYKYNPETGNYDVSYE